MKNEGWLQASPKAFEVIGSNDCGKECVGDCINWQTLLHVREAGLTETNQLKTWMIPAEKRQSFACLGFRVTKTLNSRGVQSYNVMVGNVQMWTGESGMEKTWKMHGVTIFAFNEN